MSWGVLGEIRLFAGSFEPKRWAFCDGRNLNIADNRELFSVLGLQFGGDGQRTFALPKIASLDGGGGGKVSYIVCIQGDYPQSMEGFVGAIKTVVGLYPPAGWLPCDGRMVSIPRYSGDDQRLATALGSRYGGDGTSNLALPSLTPLTPLNGTRPLPYLICVKGPLLPPEGQQGQEISEAFVGEVESFGGGYVPQGFEAAQGGSLTVQSATALWAVLQEAFGGSSGSFNLPNLPALPTLGQPAPVNYLVAKFGVYPSRP